MSSPAPTYLGQYKQLQRKSLLDYKTTALDCRGQSVRGKRALLGHPQAVDTLWISHGVSTWWCLVPLLWKLNHIHLPKGAALFGDLSGTSHLHALCVTQRAWERGSKPSWSTKGPRRGQISWHAAREAPPGNEAQSGTAAAQEQGQREWVAVAIGVPLKSSPSACPHVLLLPDTCASSWDSLGALPDLLRALFLCDSSSRFSLYLP